MSAGRRWVVGVALLAVAGSSVGHGAPSSGPVAAAPVATSAPTTQPGQSSELDGVGFFTELFGQLADDPANGDVDEWVVPDSPAATFSDYLFSFAAARRDNPEEDLPTFRVSGDGDLVVACAVDGCDEFSDLRVVDGLLDSFRLNGAVIDSRVGRPSKPVSSGSFDVQVVGAFERISVDELAVVVAVESYKDVSVDWAGAVLVDSTGVNLTVNPATSSWPAAVAPTRRHLAVVQFPGGDLGSDLLLTYIAPTAPAAATVRVAVDPLE